jgi:hypothetical protein
MLRNKPEERRSPQHHDNCLKSRIDPASSDNKTAPSTYYGGKSFSSNTEREKSKAKSIDSCQRNSRLVFHML